MCRLFLTDLPESFKRRHVFLQIRQASFNRRSCQTWKRRFDGFRHWSRKRFRKKTFFFDGDFRLLSNFDSTLHGRTWIVTLHGRIYFIDRFGERLDCGIFVKHCVRQRIFRAEKRDLHDNAVTAVAHESFFQDTCAFNRCFDAQFNRILRRQHFFDGRFAFDVHAVNHFRHLAVSVGSRAAWGKSSCLRVVDGVFRNNTLARHGDDVLRPVHTVGVRVRRSKSRRREQKCRRCHCRKNFW